MENKKKAPFVLGVIALIGGWFVPLLGLICGIIGVTLASSYGRAETHDYSSDWILNIVAISLSLLFWFLRFILLLVA